MPIYSLFFLYVRVSLSLSPLPHTKHSILSHFFLTFLPSHYDCGENGKKNLQLLWNIFIETYVFNSRGCKAFCGPLLVFKIVGTLQLHLRYFATGIIYFLIFLLLLLCLFPFLWCIPVHFLFFSRPCSLSTN